MTDALVDVIDGDFSLDGDAETNLDVLISTAGTLYCAVAEQPDATTLANALGALRREDLHLIIAINVIDLRSTEPGFTEWISDTDEDELEFGGHDVGDDWLRCVELGQDMLNALEDTVSVGRTRALLACLPDDWLRILVASSILCEWLLDPADGRDFEGFGIALCRWAEAV